MNKISTVEEEGETVAIYSHTAYQSELSHLHILRGISQVFF